MTITPKTTLKLFKETYESISEQVKEELEDKEAEVGDKIFEEEGKWYIKVIHNVECTPEEYTKMEGRGITKHTQRDGKWTNVKEVEEVIELGIPEIVLNEIKVENTTSLEELERLDPLNLPVRVKKMVLEKQKEFEQLPTMKDGWENIKTPAILPLGEGGSLLVLDTKEICPDCGRFSLSSRQSYVWAGTKDEELLGLGYGASVKHYWSSCSKCCYEYVG